MTTKHELTKGHQPWPWTHINLSNLDAVLTKLGGRFDEDRHLVGVGVQYTSKGG